MEYGHELFESRGYAQVANVLDSDRCVALAQEIERLNLSRAGSRNALSLPVCMDLAAELKAFPDLAALLPMGAVAIQCVYFEKTTEKNWLVAFHQDVSIPVRSRVSHPDLTRWSRKEGVLYIQPPVEVLESLVAIRIHLDDSRSVSSST